MQTVAIELEAGETIYSQTNCMAWMSDSIAMDTHTGGGLFAGIKRSLSGGSLFITDFTARAPGHISFAPRFPGTIVARRLEIGETLICRKETFLCAEKSVALEIAWQRRIGAGIFGGEGFILQKVTGPGTVWLDLSGEVVERSLAPGERLLVHAGHVGIQEPSVQFDIQMVPGFRNILFGGEGLFLATLTWPGQGLAAEHADHEFGGRDRPLPAARRRSQRLLEHSRHGGGNGSGRGNPGQHLRRRRPELTSSLIGAAACSARSPTPLHLGATIRRSGFVRCATG
jgi:uncharacterized protein (TIGR00266 family)